MTGIVILAAGSSSRLGKAKQNLMYNEKTLLQHAIDSAVATDCKPVVVVLGANVSTIQIRITNPSVEVVINSDWADGMASSIRCGINHLLKENSVLDAVLIMLCDQPFVNLKVLNQLLSIKTHKGVIACSYNNIVGVPVILKAKYFEDLLTLRGQDGAKKILIAHPNDIETIPFVLGLIDIDTADDYQKLLDL